MKKSTIIDEVKADVKANKVKKTISIKLSTLALIIVCAGIGALIGITIDRAITDNVNSRVDDLVNMQIKRLK